MTMKVPVRGLLIFMFKRRTAIQAKHEHDFTLGNTALMKNMKRLKSQ